jgi:Lon protease-like protein
LSILNILAGRRSQSVPIFPLNAVLYPGALLPLRIFEARYMDMAKECLKRSSPFGVCLIVEGEEVGTPAAHERVGCLARLADVDMEELGVLKARAEGTDRFRVVSSEVSKQGLIVGEVEPLAPEADAVEAPGLAECGEFLRKAIAGIGPERFREPFRFDDATWVGFRLAEILPLRNDVKQKLLELTDASLRLAVLYKFLKQQALLGTN